jgi:hypothetical protein
MPRAFVERWKPLGDGVERLSLVRQKIEDVVSPVIPQPLLEQVNLTFASALESVFRVPKKGTSDGNPGGTKGRRSKEAKKIGDRAEELVMRELRKCEEKGEIHRVTWRAQAGQTPGWDIDYLDATGALHAVEVKGTTGEVFTNIEISAQEWDQAARIRENYHLYLVTNCMTMSPCLYPITDPWGKCCSGLFNAEVALWRLRLP